MIAGAGPSGHLALVLRIMPRVFRILSTTRQNAVTIAMRTASASARGGICSGALGLSRTEYRLCRRFGGRLTSRRRGLTMPHKWESSDARYLAVKQRIIKTVMMAGMAATFVGAVYNQFNGYTGAPVYVHVVGFILLSVLLMTYGRVKQSTLLALLFGYFCFVYTPFAWLNLMGLYSSMTYVIYIFFLLITILIDGRMNDVFTALYFAEVLALVIENGIARPLENPPTPYFPMAFSYMLMLCVLIFVTRTYTGQFMRFLYLNRRDSITDVLTGLHNHRYLTDTMAEAEKLYSEKGVDYALAVIDLDDFKHINDEHGHSVGDDVLHELGILLGEVFDTEDIGRYGGDEFVAIFTKTPYDQCVHKCRQLITLVNGQTFSERNIRLTLSIGLCSRSQVDDDLFSEADAMLYAAKQNSRNTLSFK